MNNFYKRTDFSYTLPQVLIAQTPANPRDSSRLLVYDLMSDFIDNTYFNQITDFLLPSDVLVINNTKVIPARIFGYDKNQRKFEILLLKRNDLYHWECLIKPARKLKIGEFLYISDELSLELVSFLDDNGIRIIKFIFKGKFEDILGRVGATPLPPYITTHLDDPNKYQTIYAKHDGSSAAPTAGLHFTAELLKKIKDKGIKVVEILLHVGLGTFRPVKEDNILDHKMHKEFYSISEESARIINNAIDNNSRIIAVGTTTVRTLETVATKDGHVMSGEGETEIFIYPPYEFKIVNGIITNFHLPESTLLMLVSAFIGRDKTLEIYKFAVEEKYRFFSFGDAMFLTRGNCV